MRRRPSTSIVKGRSIVIAATCGALVVPALVTTGSSTAIASVRPSITRMSVSHGSSLGGTRVTIVGVGFSHVKSVQFGKTAAHIVQRTNSTKLVVTSPPHAAGLVDVVVSTATSRTALVRADRFRYNPVPVQLAVGTAYGSSIPLSFACARIATGPLECWADGYQGELGNGTATYAKFPVTVDALGSPVEDVAAGNEFACGITAAGGLKCWGSQFDGVLGNGVYSTDANSHSTTPVDVTGLTSGVRAVATGRYNACAVTAADSVKCWGANNSGLLGATAGTGSAVPVDIAGLSGVSSVVLGDTFACALTILGAVDCWGSNADGQLGAGLPSYVSTQPPTPVTGLSSGVRALSAAGHDACAVTSMGAVECWGANDADQLGDGQPSYPQTFSNTPVPVSGLASGQATAAVNGATACALSSNGGVKCWGQGGPALGDGQPLQGDQDVPVQVSGLATGAKQLSMSTSTACALVSAGGVKCWGLDNTTAVPLTDAERSVPLSLPFFG